MNDLLMHMFIKRAQFHKSGMSITVLGDSMNPEFKTNDILILENKESYEVGDVLVYRYKNDGILVHRLLRIENEQYFCKGDNSFRIEAVNKDEIAGKVVMFKRNDKYIKVMKHTKEFIDLSWLAGKESEKYNYDIKQIENSELYQKYKQCFKDIKKNIQLLEELR